MSSSYIKYRGNGFWGNDSGLEAWLQLLLEEFESLEDTEDWIEQFKKTLEIEILHHGSGCIDPELDKYFSGSREFELLINNSEKCLRRLQREEEEEIVLGNQVVCLVRTVLEVGNSFVRMLET